MTVIHVLSFLALFIKYTFKLKRFKVCIKLVPLVSKVIIQCWGYPLPVTWLQLTHSPCQLTYQPQPQPGPITFSLLSQLHVVLISTMCKILLLNLVLYIYISRFIVLLSLMVPSFYFKEVGSLYPHHALWLWEKSLCINHALTIKHSFVTFQVYSIVSHYFHLDCVHLWSYSCRLFAIPSGYDFSF